MPDTIKPGTILIRESTLLPETLRFQSEPCVPGWRLVKDLDGCGLDRKIREAGWTSFCLAGQLGATVSGIDEQKTLSRAVEQILANLESAEFNCLEIMRVASEVSKRFLGVHYMTVSAQSRHIQEGAPQSRAKDLPLRDRAPSLLIETRHSRLEAHVQSASFSRDYCEPLGQVISPPLLNASQLCEMGLRGFHLDAMLGACCIRKV
jgi:hypothetical protein